MQTQYWSKYVPQYHANRQIPVKPKYYTMFEIQVMLKIAQMGMMCQMFIAICRV